MSTGRSGSGPNRFCCTQSHPGNPVAWLAWQKALVWESHLGQEEMCGWELVFGLGSESQWVCSSGVSFHCRLSGAHRANPAALWLAARNGVVTHAVAHSEPSCLSARTTGVDGYIIGRSTLLSTRPNAKPDCKTPQGRCQPDCGCLAQRIARCHTVVLGAGRVHWCETRGA